MVLYRMYDLPLVRERTPAMQRSFMAMHRIVDGSPLQTLTSRNVDHYSAVIVAAGTRPSCRT